MMLTPNQDQIKKQLEKEGFSNFSIQKDSPTKHYSPHKHNVITTHVVLDGQITITVFGRPKVLDVSDRFDIPANVIHEATVGPNGCAYLIAEKIEDKKENDSQDNSK